MRISEITDSNKMWATIKDIDLWYAINSFDIIIQTWPLILRSRSPTLIAVHKQNLQEYLNLVNTLTDDINNFPDQSDSDLIEIHKKLLAIADAISKMIQ